MLDDMTGVGGHLMFLVHAAHETDYIPVVFTEFNVEAMRQFLCDAFVPVSWFDQIALFVQRRHYNCRIHDGPLFD